MSVFVEIKNNHKKNKSSFSRKICIKIFFGRGLVDTERVDTKPVEIRNSFDRLFYYVCMIPILGGQSVMLQSTVLISFALQGSSRGSRQLYGA
jgi:hypothetical protein